MGIVIGPVLKRHGDYRFDVWTLASGLRCGFPYRRIEDAYYARNAEIRASTQGRAAAAITCQTLDEFILKSTESETLVAARSGSRGRAVVLQTDLGMREVIELPSLLPLAACDWQCVSQSARARDALVCAGLGIERDGTFSVSGIATRL